MAIQRAVIRVPEFRYKAKILRWVDGDTADFEVFLGSRFDPIDLGFNFRHVIDDRYFGTFRMYSINAPEKYKIGGPEATAFARSLVPENTIVEIVSSKDPDSFGRYIAELYLPDHSTFSQTMLAAGHAEVYKEKKSIHRPKP